MQYTYYITYNFVTQTVANISQTISLYQFKHNNQGSGVHDEPASRAARLVADLRQLLTLKQHYYPEGGWGWIVVICAFLVHILSYGLQTSEGLLYLEILKKFGTAVKEPTGKEIL